MTGMGGADTFVIGQGHIDATITDFTLGADKLEFDNPDNSELEFRSGKSTATPLSQSVMTTSC